MRYKNNAYTLRNIDFAKLPEIGTIGQWKRQGETSMTKLIFLKINSETIYVIDLGMINQCDKALDVKGYYFNNICRKFRNLGMEKLKSQIRQFMRDMYVWYEN